MTADLVVRDVPDEVLEALKQRAAANGRSVEAEHHLLLETVLRPERAKFWERAARLRAATKGRIKGNSADLIRADRDER